MCCYSGGFALNAVCGGAVNVTGMISCPFLLYLSLSIVFLNS